MAGEYGAESGCESCPEGKTSPAGSHSIADCKEEEDVEGKTVIEYRIFGGGSQISTNQIRENRAFSHLIG